MHYVKEEDEKKRRKPATQVTQNQVVEATMTTE
jgi:hypothetical protein